jgi:hypothetical protein
MERLEKSEIDLIENYEKTAERENSNANQEARKKQEATKLMIEKQPRLTPDHKLMIEKLCHQYLYWRWAQTCSCCWAESLELGLEKAKGAH